MAFSENIPYKIPSALIQNQIARITVYCIDKHELCVVCPEIDEQNVAPKKRREKIK